MATVGEGSRRIFRLGGRWAVGGDQPVVRRTAEEGGRVRREH